MSIRSFQINFPAPLHRELHRGFSDLVELKQKPIPNPSGKSRLPWQEGFWDSDNEDSYAAHCYKAQYIPEEDSSEDEDDDDEDSLADPIETVTNMLDTSADGAHLIAVAEVVDGEDMDEGKMSEDELADLEDELDDLEDELDDEDDEGEENFYEEEDEDN
ncbi:hypothetical protein PROFUN_09282 [Planoprotostelium fungivorum]|uniref:Uncharacterized protein n=1 Tax=Planoprotostelium fungivorum TaxID=1890364 RepID=A0A2P6NKY5_9EUKA|nr:hypothetical protein PROFUN_09282 [Planoprotostelium fungivorum]